MEKNTNNGVMNLINALGLFEKATLSKIMFVAWFLAKHPEMYDYAINGILEVAEEDGEEMTAEKLQDEINDIVESWCECPKLMLEWWESNLTMENKKLWKVEIYS